MSSRLPKFEQLDSLRTIAATAVVLHHFLPEYYLGRFKYGWIGVDLFFVISGFLITAILLQQKAVVPNRLMLVRNFMAKRILRLFPAYYLLLTAFVVLRYAFHIWSWEPGQGVFYFTYTSNLLFFQHGFGSMQLNHVWTLAVEEQFYLLWPWLVLFLSRETLLRTVIAMVVLSFLFKTFCDIDHVRMLTVSHFDTLGGGALIAILGHEDGFFAWIGHKWTLLVTLSLAGLALNTLILPGPLLLNASVWFLTITLVTGCLLGHGGVWGALLDRRWMIHTGRISYGIYLYHKPIPVFFEAIHGHTGIAISPWIQLILALLLTYLIAELSYRWIERPFLRLKEHFDL